MEAVSARQPHARGFALPRRRAASLAVPVGLCLLAGVLRLWGLGRQGFWYDEATTAWLLRGTPAELLRRVVHTESTPPLAYLVAWLWIRVFGDTEVGLRSLSAVAGVAAVPVTLLAARQLVGRRAGPFAGLLVAVNPLLVWYSQEARAYSLLVLGSALSLLLFARAFANPTFGRLLAWA
jgi:mannosyltransferase